MKERVFYSARTDEFRIYRFGRYDWMAIQGCGGGVVDRGVRYEYVGDL